MNRRDPENWNVAVLGAGTMGLSIAQFFAMQGHTVKLYNRTAANLEKALVQIRRNLETLCDMGEMTCGEIEPVMKRIIGTGVLAEAAADSDYIVENLAENEELKKKVFSQLSEMCREDTILASDTSTMNIFEFVEVSHPERLMITHFFNPAYVMPLVEIVRGPETSDEAVREVKTLLESAGKTTSVLSRAIPGFILNRITMAVFREASYIAEAGIATPEDIDKAIVATFGPRYTFEGPFGLCDFAGVDIYERLATLLPPVLCSDTKCPEMLKNMTAQGKLGVKSGEGFYRYENAGEAHHLRDLKIMRMRKAIREVNEEMEKEAH